MNKDFIKWLSQPTQMNFINTSANPAERERRKLELKQRFQSEFSSVNFSTDIADLGSPDGIYASDDFATFNQKAKAHFGLSDIKNILARHNVRDSIKQYLTSRNSIIKRNKQRKAETQKALSNR